MGFSRQEYWSGLPFPSPRDLPNQGSNLGLLHCRQILYHLRYQGSPSTAWDYWSFEILERLGIEEFKFIISRTETEVCRRWANPTHLSETSSHFLSLGALPLHSCERQEEPQALVPLQHHRNPHQGHQSSELGFLSAEQGSDETMVSGFVWEISTIPFDPEFLSCYIEVHCLKWFFSLLRPCFSLKSS